MNYLCSLYVLQIEIETRPAWGESKMNGKDRRTRVIIVDDEQLIADTLATILSKSGFQAWASYRGEDAIELAREIEFDVLVSDIRLRGMSGIEAAEKILEMRPDSKVLFFSGQANASDLVNSAKLAHKFELIFKPLHPAALIELLEAYSESNDVPISIFNQPTAPF